MAAQQRRRVVLAGSIFSILFMGRIRSRIRNRQYTKKINLPLKQNSGWQALIDSNDDMGLIAKTGFDRNCLEHFTGLLKRFNRQHAIANGKDPNAIRRGPRPALDFRAQVGLTLYFLHSPKVQEDICSYFSVSPGTVSNTINNTLWALNVMLDADNNARISYPDEKEMAEFSAQIKHRHPDVPGAPFGWIDGVWFPCGNNGDPLIQNCYYNRWKAHAPSVTNILCFTPDGCICYAVLNLPGCTHDSRAAEPVYEMLDQHTPGDFCLLGDSAFPSRNNKIITPVKRPRGAPAIPANRLAYHKAVVSARQAVEWGMRDFQGLFGRLHLPLSCTDFNGNLLFLTVCCRLFNFRARMMAEGNEIKAVYHPNYVPDIFRNLNGKRRKYRHLS